ncbi:MAG: hypothetical protein IAE77_27440 [Prosthecobacter sp.]|jgi:hypothetical protein|uniref:hypothetical protein n=1 Tax=Prosthecobacter sp. TaxID=1965333 RepID=UPI0019F7A7C0|nr:hypothetical protein [Prosthecobacter sp.]MBE2287219.1 hypothetical protein [Prosthecobacter sp.]
MHWKLVLLLPVLAANAAEPLFVDAKAEVSGQWKGRETRTLASFEVHPMPKETFTRFGGLSDDRQKATGFFRVEKIGERWWMIDPEGGRFIFSGVCSLKPETKLAAKEPFEQLFGSKDAWTANTLDLLRAHGFNGGGGFSDHETLRAATQPLPYTVTLGLMSGFGRKIGVTHSEAGHTGFADDVIPVFEPGFAAFCAEECQKKLSVMKDDPWLVGVFSDNELPIKRDMLDRMLKRGGATQAAAEAFMAGKGAVTDDLRREFVQRVFDDYFRITTQAIRSVLPRHLCLGSRFHGPAKTASGVWKAAGRWCDAISMNYYDHWSPQKEHLRQWHEWSGKPCLITEFYVKGMDSGMGNTSGAGWVVRTQADRGWFYQNFTLALLESKTCIGWHWFKYMDNDPSNTKTDASNRDSNKGILNARYEPYAPLLEAMRELNSRIHPLIRQFDAEK